MKIKICGITNLEDALAATQAGADYLGLNFHPKSPRYVTVAQAQAIVAGVRWQYRDKAPKSVGIFVNTPPAQVRYMLYTAGLDYAQLHGDEGPEQLAEQRGAALKLYVRGRWTRRWLLPPAMPASAHRAAQTCCSTRTIQVSTGGPACALTGQQLPSLPAVCPACC